MAQVPYTIAISMILRITSTRERGNAARALLYSAVMNKLVAVARIMTLALPLVACTVGSDGAGGGGGGGGGGGTPDAGGGGGGGGGISGHITAPATWSGTVNITAATTIDPGVVVTVAAGTTINLKAAVGVTVAGTLDVQGTKASKVTISPETGASFHSGFTIPTGGTLKLAYVVSTGGGITTTGGSAQIVDSSMAKASGDLLIMSGGAIDMQYSQIGLDQGVTGDTTHCDMHFGGTANTIKITHSNIGTSSYGLMFYGGTAADFTANNWFSNTIDVDTQPGVSGNFTGGWFDGAAPSPGAGATLTGLNALSATKLVDAGPR